MYIRQNGRIIRKSRWFICSRIGFNEGQLIDVMVCSNAPKVELFLNDMSLGTKDIDHVKGKELVARWKVPYEKGTNKGFCL